MPYAVCCDAHGATSAPDGDPTRLSPITFAATAKQIDLNEVAIHDVENGKNAWKHLCYDPSPLQPSTTAGDQLAR